MTFRSFISSPWGMRLARKDGLTRAAGYLFQDNVPMLKTFARKRGYSGDILEDGILRVVRTFDAPSWD
jgi:hypothetical protein